ncbi:Predicted transcriptional regulators [Streptomyces sp. SceaMP-e96]|nr:Predicted transcriptional regulators [Streptomyces sp. SceaMP-e96]
MTEQPPRAECRTAEYRIEDLAHLSGATVRTIRAYQDRGLLPRPERRGRANVYGTAHLARLRQIADLLDRGYTLASIKELLEAWDAGRDLGGVLGLVAEIDGPWTDEEASRISRTDLDAAFGGSPDETALAEAVELGVLERIPDRDDEYLVPSPQELAVAAELHSAGVPLTAISGHLREVRGQVEHIAARFLDFTTEHVFQQFLDHPPTEAETAEAATLVRRLRPLAQQTIDAELARAMRTLATQYLRRHLSEALPAEARRLGGRAADTEASTGADAEARSGADTGARAEGNVEACAKGGIEGGVGAGVAPSVDGAGRGPGAGSVPAPRAAPGLPPVPPSAPGPVADSHTAAAPPSAPGSVAAPRTAAAPPSAPPSAPETVLLPAETMQAVRALVGAENTAAFIAAAAHREVQARTMDALVASSSGGGIGIDTASADNAGAPEDTPDTAIAPDAPGTCEAPGDHPESTDRAADQAARPPTGQADGQTDSWTNDRADNRATDDRGR